MQPSCSKKYFIEDGEVRKILERGGGVCIIVT